MRLNTLAIAIMMSFLIHVCLILAIPNAINHSTSLTQEMLLVELNQKSHSKNPTHNRSTTNLAKSGSLIQPENSPHPKAHLLNKPNNISDTNTPYTDQVTDTSQITTPAKLISKITAHRTNEARKADYSGTSVLEIIVGQDGTVQDIKLNNSLPYGLDQVALDIARDLKFTPAFINDKPATSKIILKIRFTSSH
ncbi:MAG: energy transducer TonB [Pseudobdellovibrio sp.]